MSPPESLAISPFDPRRSWSDGPLWARVPGSKSITNRALLLAALTPADGVLKIFNPLASRDTRLMGQALRELGFSLEESVDEKGALSLSLNRSRALAERASFHVGNAGTVARFLTAFLALQPAGRYALDGDEEMRRRPMAGLLEALAQGGTRFTFLGKENCFPFVMDCCGMRQAPAVVEVDASASSQILSALLMTAPFWPTRSRVRLRGKTVSEPFVEMTCRMMRQYWGADVVRAQADGVFAFGAVSAQKEAFAYAVEPDATAASYFLSLPLAVPLEVGVRGLSPAMLQGDIAYVGALEKTGVRVRFCPEGAVVSPVEKPRGVSENFNAFSDTFLTLAALAPLLEGPTRLSGLAHTRHQETDRLAAMAAELRKLGQGVEETEDTLAVLPDIAALARACQNGPAWVDTYKDHRFAMSFGILGCRDLRGDGTPCLGVRDPGCCAKTFPKFFDVLSDMKSLSEFPVVAIDGGAASGKSSTARALAGELHLMHVDTGSHYRALTHALLRAGVSPDDEDGVARALKTLALGSQIEGLSSRIALDGEVIAPEHLRSPEVNAAVAKFAAVPAVRDFLKDYQRGQRALAHEKGFSGLVMEGRDIGSVIFPHAPLRFFLEADESVRAARRAAEGQRDAVGERDRQDAGRKTAPLTCPQGAQRVDNSALSLAEVVALLKAKIAPFLNAARA